MKGKSEMSTTIEMRNGRKVRVTTQRSLITGELAEFIEPLDSDNDGTIGNASDVLVLNCPGDALQKSETVKHNDEGIPILNAPTFKSKSKGIKNDPRLADNVPSLPCPGDIKKKSA